MKYSIEKQLIPVIKLTEANTYRPWEYIPCPFVVIKLGDLLSSDGTEFNSTYKQIEKEGGLHNFLKYQGRILLSSIMPDKMILGFTPKMYIKCIKEFMPDFYTTPDGETYEGEFELSQKEIDRIVEETNMIIRGCRKSTPFGLVKGSKISQIQLHIESQFSLGIRHFVFHTGDFLRTDNLYFLEKSIQYAKIIRKMVPYLILYGMGSRENFRKFFFADGFITQSHYAKAFYGRIIKNGRWVAYNGQITRDIIMNNLKELYILIKNREKEHGGLRKWEEALEVSAHPTQLRA